MKRFSLVLLPLVSWLLVGMPRDTGAGPPKEDKRYEQLVKRIAELEKKVAALEARLKSPPKSALESKLVGNWAVAGQKGKGLVAVKFEANGRGRVVLSDEKGGLTTWYGPYESTGKVIGMTLAGNPGERGGAIVSVTVVSAAEARLVLKTPVAGFLGDAGEWQLDKQ